MRALSIRQPWAWAITSAGKNIENRSWSTDYRGPILIHAALNLDWYGDDVDEVEDTFGVSVPEELPIGGIVGKAKIVDVVRASDSPWFRGPFGFVLAEARLTRFVECRGALGLWVPSDDIIKQAKLLRRKRK